MSHAPTPLAPPRRLRHPRMVLDNLALVPGSVLAELATSQALANRLPRGAVLIVLPMADGAGNRALQTAGRQWRAQGRRVQTIVAPDPTTPMAAVDR